MHTFNYTSGIWRVEAKIGDAGDSKRLAVISALAGEGNSEIIAKHTLVFDHVPGFDEVAETKAYADRLLMKTH